MPVKKSLCLALLGCLSLALVPVVVAQSAPAPAPPPQHRRHRPAPPFGYHPVDSGFWKLVSKHAQPQVLSTAFGFTEGEVWSPKQGGIVYVSDEEQGHIYILKEDGSRTVLTTQVDPDGNTFDQNQQLLDCASVLHAIVRVADDGKLTTLADNYQGKAFNSPNDVVMGPDGAYYFTDPPLDMHDRKPELDYSGVYRLGRDGKVTLLFKDLPTPNGLAFSPDGKRLYVNDTKEKIVRVYDFHDGSISNGRLFIDEKTTPGFGQPDGMKVDSKGNVWVTGPGGIWVVSPAGKHLGTITFPKNPVNFAWGGPGYKTLYVGAGNTVYKLKTNVQGFVPWLHIR